MTPEKNAEILYDHYKDTFQIQLKYIDNRNRYFLTAVSLVGLLFLFVADPASKQTLAGELIKKYLSEKVSFAPYYLNSLILFGLLWTLVRYFQEIQTIRRQYKYIGALESTLTTMLDPIKIERESKAYQGDKSTAATFISTLYKLIFPILIAIAIIGTVQAAPPNQPIFYYFFDNFVGLMILLLTVLHLLRTYGKAQKPAQQPTTEAKE